MSYVVSIRRKSPITEQELVAAVDGDDQFLFADADGLAQESLVLFWQGIDGRARESFVLHHGEIDITSPSNSALQAAKSLADSLGANVVGEEGEDLTDVDFPDNDDAGCGPFVWAILGVGALLVLYWLIE